MAYITIIRDEAKREVARLISTYHKYRLPDGSTMFIDTSPAWCHHCRSFVMVEKLQSPDEMESIAPEFAANRAKNPLLPVTIISKAEADQMNREMLEVGLKEAQQWRIALRQRVSQPRCLECRNTKYIQIPEDGSWIPHPVNASHKICVDTSGMIHASLSPNGSLYDTEGLRIAAE